MKVYDGRPLTGLVITYKLDGVQVVYKNGEARSRAGKPLYNLPIMSEGVYEVYLEDWSTTVSAVRSYTGVFIESECLYRLDPPDKRLICEEQENIGEAFRDALEKEYEGLVLHSDQGMFKVKQKYTHDVEVIGVIEGKGKLKGKMGALVTKYGKVGTGFSYKEREQEWKEGTVIEVEYMEMTGEGKFRHPRFVRVREDKGVS